MVRLGEAGLVGELGPRDVAALAERFETEHVVVLPRFLDDALVARAHTLLAATALRERVHHGVGVELSTSEGPLASLLLFATNDPRLHRLIEAITRTAPLRSFQGRIFRMVEHESYDDWHSDRCDARRIGMSINLSPEPYEGGTLELRHANAEESEALATPNLTPGGAALFRIDDALVHRVTSVRGPRARTAYAGWFLSEPDFLDLLKTARPT